ncbi:sensor histidine kinase [Kineococcus indalonis]|uniref:sensor histidine kinase n=1 Tax=Kineococcus indalonis TaxID=2696566 RepID=UPI001412650C|nr:histidine kinase [Kineococcus indalonis]NAZ86979.1 sensor histidine kinase [Kineococcus indalonis]
MSRPVEVLRPPAWAQDALLALCVAVVQVQGTVVRPAEVGPRPLGDLGNLGYALLVAGGLTLAVRRRRPAPVLAVTAACSLVYFGAGFPDGPGWIGVSAALYTLTAHGDGRRSLLVAGAGTAVLATGWLLAAADAAGAALGWVFFRVAASAGAAVLGESVRSRRVAAVEALQRARWAERTREEEARSRVDAERLRIAREVHDTVAHAIAVINVQAGVSAYLLDRQPHTAREALVTIERTSARALDEMRALLGVLRDPDGERLAHPGLQQVPELTAVARRAGLEVEVTPGTALDPSAEPLPSAVQHTAYRIVQQSLTNVLTHVGPTRVTVSIERGGDVLEVRVADEGARGAPSARPGAALGAGGANGGAAPAAPGRGIVGMRERCVLLGGNLTAAPRPGGGFEVTARLPLTPAGVLHP